MHKMTKFIHTTLPCQVLHYSIKVGWTMLDANRIYVKLADSWCWNGIGMFIIHVRMYICMNLLNSQMLIFRRILETKELNCWFIQNFLKHTSELATLKLALITLMFCKKPLYFCKHCTVCNFCTLLLTLSENSELQQRLNNGHYC